MTTRKVQSLMLVLALTCTGATPATWAALVPRTMTVNFDGENRNKIISIRTAPGIGTTFRLPEELEIQDLVVADTKGFAAQSNGHIAIVKALEANRATSVLIYTTTRALFSFHLTSQADPSGQVDELVVIELNDRSFFRPRPAVQRPPSEDQCKKTLEESLETARLEILLSANTGYAVKDSHFSIGKVVDDRVRTWVQLRAQDRPAVFLGRSPKAKKDWQPVKFVDEGTHYLVHRVLGPEERFYLVVGDQVSEIRRSHENSQFHRALSKLSTK